jgi:hypothetical protein
MSPEQFKAARHRLGLSLWQMAYLLGLEGSKDGRRFKIDEIEMGRRPVTGPMRRLLRAYLDGYRPCDWDDVVEGAIRPTTVNEPRSRTAALGSAGRRPPQD